MVPSLNGCVGVGTTLISLFLCRYDYNVLDGLDEMGTVVNNYCLT